MANEEAEMYLTELRKLRGTAKDPDVVRALSGEIEKLERARSLAELRELQSAAKNPHVLSLLLSEIEKLEKKQEVVSGSVGGAEVKKEMLMSMDPHGNEAYSKLPANECSLDLSDEHSNPPPVPSQIPVQQESTQRKIRRTKNFSTQEDMMLISAWLNVSIDLVHGTTYWERVHSYYHKYKKFQSDRTSNSLMHRWSSIHLTVGKFHGYFMQIEARQQSGVNEQDKVCQAMEMYHSLHHTAFQFLHCWNELKNAPKWCTGGSKKKSKNTRNASPATSSSSTPDSISKGEDDVVGDTIVRFERPLGGKDIEEQINEAKGKKTVENSTSNPVANFFEEYKEEQKVWMQEKAEQLERLYAQEREMIVIKREKLRLKEMIEEERIMAIDTTKMQSPQAEYYKALQMKIMTKIVLR